MLMSRRATKPAARPVDPDTSKTTTINLRVSQPTRQLIDAAAAAVGKSRTEFMLESARQHAIDVMVGQHLVVLDPVQHDSFMRVLDNPPPPNARLKKLMLRKSPWET